VVLTYKFINLVNCSTVFIASFMIWVH